MKKSNTVLDNGWKVKIGFYPTPDNLVDQFAQYTFDFYKDHNSNNEIKLLDLFAGDGRLGYSVKNYFSQNKYTTKRTYLEIQQDEIRKIIQKEKKATIINVNAFEWRPNEKFDLVVSNPPYLILNSPEAKKLGFDWEYVKKHGRNLYTLGIIKALELCKEGGIVAVISPFSWLRGEFSHVFRKEINSLCKEVLIRANDHRTIFKGVNQDIGIQFFVKRTQMDTSITKWMFGYNGFEPQKIPFKRMDELNGLKIKLDSRIMVGPVVWNRNKQYLSKKLSGTTLVIYGGNITHSGKLDIKVERYKEKQYIANSALPKTSLFESPLILIRRVMRGIPGNWQIDSCLIEKPFKCTVENHVIVIEIPSGKIDSYKHFYQKLMSKIKEYYYFSGSPSISGKVVKRLISELENEYNYEVKKIFEKNNMTDASSMDLLI